jgi:hypothetical protein
MNNPSASLFSSLAFYALTSSLLSYITWLVLFNFFNINANSILLSIIVSTITFALVVIKYGYLPDRLINIVGKEGWSGWMICAEHREFKKALKMPFLPIWILYL